jgi:hypothetical protein
MMKANIEINDREYLIKFSREDFNLEYLSRFVNQILNGDPSNQIQTTGDIITRTFNYDAPNRFDCLEDK